MPEKILKKICAGDNPVFGIVEGEDSPAKVTLRVVDDPSQQIGLPKSVLRTLGNALIAILEAQ